MKKTFLLLGIVAMALGNMTSCSNILEEEGTIPASAKTGTLVLALEQDNSVNVVTKTVTDAGDDYVVKLYSSSATYIDNKKYSEVKGQSYSLPAAENAYTLESYNIAPDKIEMCAWDKPAFYGKKENITVTGGQTNEVELTCTRKNSQITIDKTDLESEEAKKVITITSLRVKNGETYFSLIGGDATGTLGSNILYVKEGIPAQLELLVTRVDDTSISTSVITPLNGTTGNVGNTEAAKNYEVTYKLSTEYGVTTIVIKVDDTITEVKLDDVVVNPYQTTEK